MDGPTQRQTNITLRVASSLQITPGKENLEVKENPYERTINCEDFHIYCKFCLMSQIEVIISVG